MVGIWIPADLGTYINGVTLASCLDPDQIKYMLGGAYHKFFMAPAKKHRPDYLEVCFARRDSMSLPSLPMNLRASTYVSNRQHNPMPLPLPADDAGTKLAEHEWIGGGALLVGFNSNNEWGQKFVSVYAARTKVNEWKKRDRSLAEMLTTT